MVSIVSIAFSADWCRQKVVCDQICLFVGSVTHGAMGHLVGVVHADSARSIQGVQTSQRQNCAHPGDLASPQAGAQGGVAVGF